VTNASGAPASVTENATNIGTITATINGTVNANCNITVVTFEYGTTVAYGTSVTADQSPVSGGVVTDVSYDLAGLIVGQTYHFRVVASNTGGTTYGDDMTFTTGAVPPTVLTSAATGIGNFIATLNSSVNANNLSTSTSFEYGLTTSYGNTIAGVPSTVTGNTATPVTADISGLNYNTTYHFRGVAQNSAGTTFGNDMTFNTLCPIPANPGTISGPTELCQATSGHVYSIAAVTYATGYTWTVPTGASITAGNNTPSITVSYGSSAVSGNVTVNAYNECGPGTTSSLAVTVNPIPVPVITGPDPACVGSTYAYSTAAGQTGYTWAVSPGGQIMAGSGTSSIQVKWNSTGAQWVSVNYTSSSGCAGATPTIKNVTVSSLPSPTITGLNVTCPNSGWLVYTTEGGFSNYTWTVSSGGTIISGQGTYQIEVDWTTAGPKTVTVNYTNASGCFAASPASYSVTVLALPAPAGSITGTDELCDGQQGSYSVNTIANASSYEWTIPAGATIIEGAGTSVIKVQFGPGGSSGNITVYGMNNCGIGPTSPAFHVTVNPIPPTPVVTVDAAYLLTSSASSGNQWYFNGTMIDGATGQTYQAEEEGFYWTIVTLNGCSSAESNHVEVLFVGLDELPGTHVNIFPIPNSGKFTVSLTNQAEQYYQVFVSGNLGVRLFEIKDWKVNGKAELEINLGEVPEGMYTLVIQNKNNQVIRKIIVTK
jgi:hypothetical protein